MTDGWTVLGVKTHIDRRIACWLVINSVQTVQIHMRNSSSKIIQPHEILGYRMRMVQCIEDEPEPPTDPVEFEKWCESGKSGRPIQTHIGDCGTVLQVVGDSAICVRFDDCDERFLHVDEIFPCSP